MMKAVHSPSALTAFLACQHLAALQLARVPAPPADNSQAELIRRKGDEHERAYLEELRARDLEIVEIGRGDWERAAVETAEALGRARHRLRRRTVWDGAVRTRSRRSPTL